MRKKKRDLRLVKKKLSPRSKSQSLSRKFEVTPHPYFTPQTALLPQNLHTATPVLIQAPFLYIYYNVVESWSGGLKGPRKNENSRRASERFQNFGEKKKNDALKQKTDEITQI